MHHLKLNEVQLELEIFVEPFSTKKHCLEIAWATSFFEIVLLFVYLEYDEPNQNQEVIQVNHLHQVTARDGILMFFYI